MRCALCESKSESESANSIGRNRAAEGDARVCVVCACNTCVWVCVSEFRNVANRSYNRWPDRKIIEKYCREDNNLFWQVCFRWSRRRRCRRRHRLLLPLLSFVCIPFRFPHSPPVIVMCCKKNTVPIKYLWFRITIFTAHCCRSFSHSQNNFRIPICSCTTLNKHEKKLVFIKKERRFVRKNRKSFQWIERWVLQEKLLLDSSVAVECEQVWVWVYGQFRIRSKYTCHCFVFGILFCVK